MYNLRRACAPYADAETSLLVYIFAGLFASLPAVLAIIAISRVRAQRDAWCDHRGVLPADRIAVDGLGPFAVGLATDYLFQDKAAIGRSLSLVSLVTGLPGGILLAIGLGRFAKALAVRHGWLRVQC